MSPRRLVVVLALASVGVLAVAIPVMAGGGYGPSSIPKMKIAESNGVPDGPASSHAGNVVVGKRIFVAFCGRCHVMKVVNTKGTLGPNLDTDPVTYTTVVNAIVQGVGGVQAEYLLRALTFGQIYDVAKFVTVSRKP